MIKLIDQLNTFIFLTLVFSNCNIQKLSKMLTNNESNKFKLAGKPASHAAGAI